MLVPPWAIVLITIVVAYFLFAFLSPGGRKIWKASKLEIKMTQIEKSSDQDEKEGLAGEVLDRLPLEVDSFEMKGVGAERDHRVMETIWGEKEVRTYIAELRAEGTRPFWRKS